MDKLLGKKIIRWDTTTNSMDEIVKIEFILDDGKRLTIESSDIYKELDIKID
jgi:hypothetical protein